MRLTDATEKLQFFLRQEAYIDPQEKPDVLNANDTIHEGQRAWIFHTSNPADGIFVVFHTGKVKDFYQISEH